tara:strand:+ start:108 stop:740 length:633 start_codon:yes stop_codon:yes gene_type:complete
MPIQKNKVELLEYSGSDISHARAAWASTNQEVTPDKIERIAKLLKFLADNEHGTPFEHSMLSFHVQGDIASHIHCLKHRTGVSINTESARYKEMKDDLYYLPKDWPKDMMDNTIKNMEQQHFDYHTMLERLDELGVTRSRAKEMARYILPYSHQLRWVMTFNFRSFMHFQKLRNSEHAQVEIKEIAESMLDLVKYQTDSKFTHSLQAFNL